MRQTSPLRCPVCGYERPVAETLRGHVLAVRAISQHIEREHPAELHHQRQGATDDTHTGGAGPPRLGRFAA
jgi:hypothetical protein